MGVFIFFLFFMFVTRCRDVADLEMLPNHVSVPSDSWEDSSQSTNTLLLIKGSD